MSILLIRMYLHINTHGSNNLGILFIDKFPELNNELIICYIHIVIEINHESLLFKLEYKLYDLMCENIIICYI